MVAPEGHVWLLPGGMHGCSRGACMVAPRGHAWLLPGACMVVLGGACMVAPGGHAWLLLGGMHGCPGGCVVAVWGACIVAAGGHAWDTTRYGDTINERVVRILLECILVVLFFNNCNFERSNFY